MDKKGLLNFNAVPLAIFLLIYFIMFSFIVSSVNNAFPNTLNSSQQNQKDYFNDIKNKLSTFTFNYCDSPRYRYDLSESTPYELSSANNNNLRCDFTDGILNQQNCEAYDGCGWTSVQNTSGWSNFFCGWLQNCDNEYYTCQGFILSDNYGIQSSGFGNSSRRVSTYHFMDYYNSSENYNSLINYLGYDNFTVIFGHTADKTSTNICTHPNVILNETACDLFQCMWSEITSEDMSAKKIKNSIISIAYKTFTFQYNFGFSNTGISLLLNLLFVFIPLLIFIIAIFYAIFGG
jgi:hypothetical protein